MFNAYLRVRKAAKIATTENSWASSFSYGAQRSFK